MLRETSVFDDGELRERSREGAHARMVVEDVIVLVAILTLGLSTRLLIAPYTSHGYDIEVHRTWLFSLLEKGPFFYTSPQGMGLFGKSWAHDPNFCELPPIYPSTLFLMGNIYAFLRPSLDDVYLLVLLMKLPQIIAECGIAVLIYYIIRKEIDFRLGTYAALLFLLNPFTFFLTAVWGAPESLVAVFVIASLYASYKGMHILAAWLLGVSLIVKPYSIVFLIPLLLFSYPDLKFPKTLMLPLITALSAAVTASPWLIAQGSVFIEAMWAGAVHNLGIRMWDGTIWAFPSFWQIIKGICEISGIPYAVVAPFQFYVYLSLTFILCYVAIGSRANLEKENIWFMAYLFLFAFMMFMPSAHEKWEYACFPLIIISAFLKREHRMVSLLIYAGLTFTLFEGIYGDCRYFFTSTDVLPMPRKFAYAGIFAEASYHALWSTAGVAASQFSSLPHAVFSTIIFFLSFKQALALGAPPRLQTSSAEPSSSGLQKALVVDPLQMRLEMFRVPSQERRLTKPVTPIGQIENEVNSDLKAFQSYIKAIGENSLRLTELTKIFRNGEIPEDAYRLLTNELADSLSISVQKMFRLREMLELARAKAKLMLTQERESLREFETPEGQRMLRMLGKDSFERRKLYQPVMRWKEIISRIDSVLSSLTIDEEVSIIEQYLSLIRESSSLKTRPGEIEENRVLCQRRLSAISERWTAIRQDKVEQIMNLEQKASRIKSGIEELEVRFSVGEFDQGDYEYRLSTVKGALKRGKRKVSGIRRYVDEMDVRIFRVSELLKECDQAGESE